MALRRLLLVWLALMLLLGLTVLASFVLTGAISLAAGLAIGLAKAVLIAWTYMHLKEEDGLVRIMFAGVAVWLFILLGLGAADLATRGTF